MAQSVWTKAPMEIIKDLIAAANSGFAAVEGEFDLGVPATNSGNKNTKVTVTPNSANYTGTVDVTYNRLTLAAYIAAKLSSGTVAYGDGAGEVKLTDASSSADKLKVVNAVLGLNVLASEFKTLTVSAPSNNAGTTTVTVDLEAADASLLFLTTGSFTVTYTTPAAPTSSVIQNTELDGLNAPTA